jgi:hypothetical protein
MKNISICFKVSLHLEVIKILSTTYTHEHQNPTQTQKLKTAGIYKLEGFSTLGKRFS